MLNRKYIFYIIGLLLVFESLLMLLPVVVAVIYREHEFFILLISALITFGAGSLLWYYNRDPDKDIGKREGYLIASLVWIVFSLFGAFPFYLSHYFSTYTDSFFETISGFTTTGASILIDIEALPYSLLFWRSTTHLVGGMGILVISIVVLPVFGSGSMYLYGAETSSAASGKLQPKIKDTASRLLWIYLALIAILTGLLLLGKMNFFDALCHSFGTIASGGFSPKNTSIIRYSPYIQYVISIFMLIAAINFNLHYYLFKGNFNRIFRNEELRTFLVVTIAAIIIIGLCLFYVQHSDAETSFRNALFNVATIISTTGFANTDYMLWPTFLWFLLFILLFVNGCAGSTSGGIKIVRYILLFKNIPRQFRRILHGRSVETVRLNGEIVQEELLFRTVAFFLIYLLVWAGSTFLLIFSGLPMIDSMGGTAACMAGCGPGLGSVGPVGNYAHLTDFAKWVLSFDMLAGRLELFSFLILFTPFFWKND